MFRKSVPSAGQFRRFCRFLSPDANFLSPCRKYLLAFKLASQTRMRLVPSSAPLPLHSVFLTIDFLDPPLCAEPIAHAFPFPPFKAPSSNSSYVTNPPHPYTNLIYFFFAGPSFSAPLSGPSPLHLAGLHFLSTFSSPSSCHGQESPPPHACPIRLFISSEHTSFKDNQNVVARLVLEIHSYPRLLHDSGSCHTFALFFRQVPLLDAFFLTSLYRRREPFPFARLRFSFPSFFPSIIPHSLGFLVMAEELNLSQVIAGRARAFTIYRSKWLPVQLLLFPRSPHSTPNMHSPSRERTNFLVLSPRPAHVTPMLFLKRSFGTFSH